MTDKYYLKIENKKKNIFWQIVETETKMIVQEFLTEDKAEKRLRFFNKGGAFGGFTPRFFFTNPTYVT